MDCEKFDLHVIEALYDELDELTHAALKRHVDGCSRCAGIFSGFRATREVGILPIEEPSEGLEDRIMEAVATAQKKTPFGRKVLRGITWAGSQAMRPQLAMAALFFLVIGSSLLLLRASPRAPLRVTEHGTPTPEATEAPSPIAFATPPPAESAAPAAAEMPADGARYRKDEKEKDKAPSRAEANAALAEARALRDRSGCNAAVSKFDEVGARFPATSAAADAMWDAAQCYRTMGEGAKNRELLQALRSNTSYRERAESELAAQETNNLGNAQRQVAARPAARHAPAAAPPPPAATAVPTQQVAGAKPGEGNEQQQGSSGRAVAAPKRASSPHSAEQSAPPPPSTKPAAPAAAH